MVNDWENSKVKKEAELILVFWSSFEVILSGPADDDNFSLSIKQEIPSTEKNISGISGTTRVEKFGRGALDSWVKTDEKVEFTLLAHSKSGKGSPVSLGVVIVRCDLGLMVC